MRIGVIIAMDKEKKVLINSLSQKKSRKIAGQIFTLGKLFQKTIIIAESGIGKVQAAMTTTILINNYHPDLIVNTGSAGSLSSKLGIGDQIIATCLAYYDVFNTIRPGSVGQIPGKSLYFKSNHSLIKKFQKVNPKAKEGLVVSGDSFVMQKTKEKILQNFPKALAAEMEGVAVAQVSNNFEVPFIVLRAISDSADGSANISFDKFLEKAGEKSAEIFLNFAKAIR